MWYLGGWGADTYFKVNWYNTKRNYNYVYCPECIVRIMEKRARPQKLKECGCNGYVWNFGDPMGSMPERGAKGVYVNRINYDTIKRRNRNPMRDTEDIIQENRFYENGVIKCSVEMHITK
jgi:hypothetical protein